MARSLSPLLAYGDCRPYLRGHHTVPLLLVIAIVVPQAKAKSKATAQPRIHTSQLSKSAFTRRYFLCSSCCSPFCASYPCSLLPSRPLQRSTHTPAKLPSPAPLPTPKALCPKPRPWLCFPLQNSYNGALVHLQLFVDFLKTIT